MSKRSDARVRELLASMANVTADLSVDVIAHQLVIEAMNTFGATAGLLELTGATQAQGQIAKGKDALELIDISHHEEPKRLRIELKTRGERLGKLTLGPKNGKDRYSKYDKELASALAGAAGVALENAQLYQDTSDRVRWLEATATIGSLLGGDKQQTRGLDNVAELARQEARAKYSFILTPLGESETQKHSYRIAGISQNVHPSLAGRIITKNATEWPKPRDDTGTLLLMRPEPVLPLGEIADGGHTLLTELHARNTHYGILLMIRELGQPSYRPIETQMAQIFASNTAQGIGLVQAHHLHEEVRLYLERERIARDLHDIVIQRIFAAGLSISALAKHLPTDKTRERAQSIAQELDTTIAELRATIYSLRTGTEDHEQPSSRILRTIKLASESLTFTPRVHLGDGLDTLNDETLLAHLQAVITESITNVVRHAHAHTLSIDVRIKKQSLELTVNDDGMGISTPNSESGIANMRQRASELGGNLTINTDPSEGTLLTWAIPLPAN
ncbi:hypothetical protein CQ018_11685 [Arthrobacter sp. MYb227]|uniref:sensor histidine kinase n=1 Tax=Arthrobacter sp. MYb227 TaxID=1848601 RepID=UPI000CFC5032|nr:sensor histidine kinase [Arthrobacter sp. MYb227]PQZ92178.1 hypothetical protein CQ018_11685 [Arthrobacter sp. MYb227]